PSPAAVPPPDPFNHFWSPPWPDPHTCAGSLVLSFDPFVTLSRRRRATDGDHDGVPEHPRSAPVCRRHSPRSAPSLFNRDLRLINPTFLPTYIFEDATSAPSILSPLHISSCPSPQRLIGGLNSHYNCNETWPIEENSAGQSCWLWTAERSLEQDDLGNGRGWQSSDGITRPCRVTSQYATLVPQLPRFPHANQESQ